MESNKAALISIVLVMALAGAYLSVVVVGQAVEERKYVYSSPLDYALDYLSDEPYTRLAIEVDYVDGYPPSESALNFLIQKIYEYTEKKYVFIDRNATDRIPLRQATYDISSIRAMENTYRDDYKHGNTAVLYILYLNGLFRDTGAGLEATHTDVAGLEYGYSSIAIFKQEIIDYSDNLYQQEYMERSVLLHEFGHTIALVGIGYYSPQEDPEHPHHSIHPDAVMYYAINASAGIPPQDFCNDSKRDIQTIMSHQREESPVIYVPWMLLLADILAAVSIIAAIVQEKPPEPPQVRYESEYIARNEYAATDAESEEEQYF